MKVLLVLVLSMVMHSSLAAKKRDIFGSKLKSKITRKERGYTPRSLAKSFLSRTQCTNLAQENLKRTRKSIKSFSV